MEIIQILTLIAVIISIIGVPWYLRGYLGRLEQRMARLEQRMTRLDQQGNGLLNITGKILDVLLRGRLITGDDLQVILANFAEMSRIVEMHPNPLSEEELRRLNEYIRKAKRGELFTPAEVEDYNRLVSVLEKERSDDPNVWPLVALGAFLLGLFLGTRKQT